MPTSSIEIEKRRAALAHFLGVNPTAVELADALFWVRRNFAPARPRRKTVDRLRMNTDRCDVFHAPGPTRMHRF